MTRPKLNNDQIIAKAVRDIGFSVRERIAKLPPEVQELAFACVASAVVGAAVNDSKNRKMTVGMVQSTIMALELTHAKFGEEK